MPDGSFARLPPGMEAPPFREFAAQAYVCRRQAMTVLGSVTFIFVLVSAIMQPHYKAQGTLAILPAPEFTVRPNAGSNELNASALAMDQIMKAETGILESDDLHETVLVRLGVGNVYPDIVPSSPPGFVHVWLRPMADPWLGPSPGGAAADMDRALHRFASDLDVHASKDGNVIDVAFIAHDGPTAAQVVNTLLATYASRRSHLYDDPQLRVVTRETETLRNATTTADANLVAFKAAHTISNYDEERSLVLKRRDDAQQSLADADMSAAEQQARIAALDRQIAGQPRTTDIFVEHDTDIRLQAIDAALVDLRTRLAAARVHYLDTSRMVTDLNTQIIARMNERRQLAADPVPSVARSGPNPAMDQLRLDGARAHAELAAASARAISLQRLLADISAALMEADGNERTLYDLQRQKQAADENYATANRVMAERRLTEAEDALRLANVRVIQAGRTPLRPAPMKFLLVLAGAMTGALTSAAYLIWRFTARPTFLTAAGLEHATGLPVLGVFHTGDWAAAAAV